MAPRRPSVNRGLTWFHRWAGVLLCLLFVLWFASGAILHFVTFPSLKDTERLARGEAVELSQVAIAPSVVLTRFKDADALSLISVAGRPVYLASTGGDAPRAIFADNGQLMPPIPDTTARLIVERFSSGAVVRVDGPLDYDQWVVHQRYDRYRPFFRVKIDDADGTELYVSARTGQVVQKTTTFARAWNWCGAVMHWLYFTPLRKSWSAWDQSVWWISLIALGTTLVGTWLGILRYLRNRQAGRAGISPFRGWLRWHHIFGLFTSVIVLVWIFSGWLSMDHGRLFSRVVIPRERMEQYRGLPLSAVTMAASLDQIHLLGRASEITFYSVDGQPFITAQGGGRSEPGVRWLQSGSIAATERIPASLLLSGVRAAWPGAQPLAQPPNGTDEMYRLAEGVTPDAKVFLANGDHADRIFVDASTGRLLVVMNPSRRSYAWWYYAPHTFNFPGLIARPALRTTLVLALLAVGLVFSVIGTVIGFLRLKRDLSG